MDKPKTTPKDFFLWAGAVISFYWSVISFVLLILQYIDYTFPNALTYYPANPYESAIGYQMASVCVLLPIFLLLSWVIQRDITKNPSLKDLWVRRWALILTLFVASVAMVGDLVALLTTFFNGEEMTTGFLLKVLVIFLVAAGVFMHFIADFGDYWDRFPQRRRLVAIGVVVLATATIISGFLILGTPAEARLALFDSQKVNDLQNIQQQVITYWQAKQTLPRTIAELNNSLTFMAPVDMQSGEPYRYEATGALTFKLCATFNKSSQPIQFSPETPRALEKGGVVSRSDSWQHEVGERCFDRTIDPGLYPPFSRAQP